MSRVLLLLLLVGAVPASAQSTHALIVSGVSGEPRIAERMQRDAAMLHDALKQRFGAHVMMLSERSAPRSDQTGIGRALHQLAVTTGPGDRIVIILMGHGSAQNGEPRFNIPGPDITVTELDRALAPLRGRALAVVIATSASGAFTPALQKDDRIIVTATRNGAENEEVVFAEYFARALAEDVADADKDNGVSIAEALEYAKAEVNRFYQQQNRLVTEHAQMSGAGDAFVLRTGGAAPRNAALQSMHDERAELERRIAVLRTRKADLTPAAYDAELERLLLELARKNQQIRRAEVKP